MQAFAAPVPSTTRIAPAEVLPLLRLERERAQLNVSRARELRRQLGDVTTRVQRELDDLQVRRQAVLERSSPAPSAAAGTALAPDTLPLAPRPGAADLERLHVDYWESKDDAIRDELLVAYSGLARHLARSFAGRGEPVDDLEQVALFAVFKALHRFEPARDVKFATYASRVVNGELKRHFRDRTWAMRVPRSLQELYLRTKRGVEELRGELSRSPTIPELAVYLGVNQERLLEAMEAGGAYRLVSLDAPVGDDPGQTRQVADDDPGMGRIEQVDLVRSLVSRLDDDDREIVRLYYGEGLSQAEIGRRLAVSQVHVSRRLARVLDRLRVLAEAPV